MQKVSFAIMSLIFIVSCENGLFALGEKDITITVFDTSSNPKSDTVQQQLFLDNTAPLLSIINPAGYPNHTTSANENILPENARTDIEASEMTAWGEISIGYASCIYDQVYMKDVE